VSLNLAHPVYITEKYI